jgi:hypothetical protein
VNHLCLAQSVSVFKQQPKHFFSLVLGFRTQGFRLARQTPSQPNPSILCKAPVPAFRENMQLPRSE